MITPPSTRVLTTVLLSLPIVVRAINTDRTVTRAAEATGFCADYDLRVSIGAGGVLPLMPGLQLDPGPSSTPAVVHRPRGTDGVDLGVSPRGRRGIEVGDAGGKERGVCLGLSREPRSEDPYGSMEDRLRRVVPASVDAGPYGSTLGRRLGGRREDVYEVSREVSRDEEGEEVLDWISRLGTLWLIVFVWVIGVLITAGARWWARLWFTGSLQRLRGETDVDEFEDDIVMWNGARSDDWEIEMQPFRPGMIP